MSPNDIFAAQFWPWPDPAIKRDSQGGVLFVNAAFLALYGGTVQDWTGNAVGGWPAPQASGQPYRFETRMPQTQYMPEQVYDWLEMFMDDGNAFALARNVTIFMEDEQSVHAVPGSDATDMHMAAAAQHAQMETAHSNAAHMQAAAGQVYAQAEVHAPVYEPISAQAIGQVPSYDPAQYAGAHPAASLAASAAEPQYSAPIDELPPMQNTAHPAITHHAAMTHQAAPLHEAVHPEYEVPTLPQQAAVLEHYSDTHNRETSDQALYEPKLSSESLYSESLHSESVSSESLSTGNDIPNMPFPPAEPPASPPASPPEEPAGRAYERRALPIESESSILGNNWRDAVIAKAVGADDVHNARQQKEDVAAKSDSEAESQGVKRILLAEDNAINALLTRTLLEAEGHKVETVQDGQLAVEAMKTSTYDLIFMDMRMPNMDGLEATRKIRTLPNVSKELPIIALTANAFDDDRNACFDSGMNDFMTKPVSAEELSEMVEQWTKTKETRMTG